MLPLFLLLLLGLVDFGRLLFSYISLTNGTRELARNLVISTSTNANAPVDAFNNLTIFGGSVSSSTDSVVVHVDDTGPGVAPEIRSKLFQPFVTAGKSNGVGLGLVFTRQTVLEHGGDLWLDIAPGGGARFSLRLPGAHVVQSQALAV